MCLTFNDNDLTITVVMSLRHWRTSSKLDGYQKKVYEKIDTSRIVTFCNFLPKGASTDSSGAANSIACSSECAIALS